ncbi:hypothetical protein SOCE26_056780 [Sorangium cellulosum]|uniref:DUF2243 domain-containing protein n=1 Tax=Sorangium cellulosum TaxID=56 RepID=A0A2L0EY27_SORCE|nr:DUF2243 domain-containing protein [Sorangium cellulosum]AUX44214.1 hypothetical protein SOCE26_056780 [Sorangium cellulosum]
MSTARPFETGAAAMNSRAVKVAGVLFGIGAGGLIDGILFHQLLQWHHLICFSCHPGATIDDVRRNIFADGLFSVVAFGLTVAGVGKLWSALRAGVDHLPGRIFPGAAAVGWGVFNLVEGVIDHHLLQIHHVRPGPGQLGWDLAFLAFGALLVVVGARLMRGAPRPVAVQLPGR